jgi:hypothetical protein
MFALDSSTLALDAVPARIKDVALMSPAFKLPTVRTSEANFDITSAPSFISASVALPGPNAWFVTFACIVPLFAPLHVTLTVVRDKVNILGSVILKLTVDVHPFASVTV